MSWLKKLFSWQSSSQSFHNQVIHNKQRLANLNKKMMTRNRRTKQKKQVLFKTSKRQEI